MLTTVAPRERALKSLSPHGFHRVVWYEWGDPANPRVAVCVHALTRNGRDFDVLAEALSATHRVLAIDLPGRGRSEWLHDPEDYVYPTYLTALTAMLAAAGAEQVDWIGTSLGGLLGIVAAAQRQTPITRLVVNDVGPVIEPAALQRIAGYVGLDPRFATEAEAATYIRTISAPFGGLTEAQWEHLTSTTIRAFDDGRYGVVYDPGIAVPFRRTLAPPELWPLWDQIRCPTLVLRGAQSDLLSRATAEAMTTRGPKATLIEIPQVGHAPMLMSPPEIDPVLAFLRG